MSRPASPSTDIPAIMSDQPVGTALPAMTIEPLGPDEHAKVFINEILDDMTDLDASFDAQDTADLAQMLESTQVFQEKIKTKLRNSNGRDGQLKDVQKAIRERQKTLLICLKEGNMSRKKLADIVEAFRNLTIRICGIMGKTVYELSLYQEVLNLLSIIPKNGDNTERALLLKFVFNSMNLQVKLLLKGNSDRLNDLEDVLRDFAAHMATIVNAQLDASEDCL